MNAFVHTHTHLRTHHDPQSFMILPWHVVFGRTIKKDQHCLQFAFLPLDFTKSHMHGLWCVKITKLFLAANCQKKSWPFCLCLNLIPVNPMTLPRNQTLSMHLPPPIRLHFLMTESLLSWLLPSYPGSIWASWLQVILGTCSLVVRIRMSVSSNRGPIWKCECTLLDS